MQKILYAINHRITEDAISECIKKDEFLPVGAVTYKEAILEKMNETRANVLLIRDTLPGSMSLERLLKRVRIEYPEARIVVICSERPKQDPFLQNMVNLAIYDIINSDKPTLSEICSYILSPRTIRDAAQYGFGLHELPNGAAGAESHAVRSTPAEKPTKKPGLLTDMLKGFSSIRRPGQASTAELSAPNNSSTEYATPQVDLSLLRESMKESLTRDAQKDMDSLIKNAADEQTATLLEQKASLQREIDSLKSELAVSERQSVVSIEDLNLLRSDRDKLKLSLNDTRKEMQSIIDLYEEQLRALHNPTNTPTWYQEQSTMWEAQKTALTKDLNELTRETADQSVSIELLSKQVRDGSEIISTLKEKLSKAQDMQLGERAADGLIAQLRAESSEAKGRTTELTTELNSIKAELSIAREGGPDYSRPLTDVPLLPDDTIYTASGDAPQTILVLGSKHGVGSTTVALNLATSLASRGRKTLLIEVNGVFPLINEYFELTHVPFGVDEAFSSIAGGDMSSVDKAIIRPHGLRPSQSALYKTYKKLPAGLHFMLFSNESLVSGSYAKNHAITEATLYTLLGYLTKRQQYSHVILDVQCDDDRFLQCVLSSGFQIDKLCMVMNQDPHAVSTAGLLITKLSRARAASLVAGGEFIINRFNPNAPITVQKIEKMLHIGSAQISKYSEDSAGYLSASGAGLPYMLNRGRFWMEHDVLRNKIVPNS